ncbi:hypothetical protein DEV91_14028 [Phyllobacterium brassicacearum]|nr:hypothetical protein DEV91_14028 [Phyllobacterium brassicacearum]
MSVTMTRGAQPCFLRSLRIKRLAAFVSLRLCTRTSIDCKPQKMLPAIDGDDNLIKVPLVIKAGGTTADSTGVVATEFLRPVADCLVRYDDAPIGEHIFHHAKTERKAKIQPYRFGYYFSWKTVTVIKWIMSLGHHSRSQKIIANWLSLRCPNRHYSAPHDTREITGLHCFRDLKIGDGA